MPTRDRKYVSEQTEGATCAACQSPLPTTTTAALGVWVERYALTAETQVTVSFCIPAATNRWSQTVNVPLPTAGSFLNIKIRRKSQRNFGWAWWSWVRMALRHR